jgi:hypothetical protein
VIDPVSPGERRSGCCETGKLLVPDVQVGDPITWANASAVCQHIPVRANGKLNSKKTFGRIGVFDDAVAQPQTVVKRREHCFQPRELPTVPAKVFGVGFHDAVRAQLKKPLGCEKVSSPF